MVLEEDVLEKFTPRSNWSMLQDVTERALSRFLQASVSRLKFKVHDRKTKLVACLDAENLF